MCSSMVDLPFTKTSTNILSLAIQAANIWSLIFPKLYLLQTESTKSLYTLST